MKRLALAAAAGFSLLLSAPASLQAADTGGCDSFSFPVATDLQWMRSPDAEPLSDGAKLTSLPAKAMLVTLKPVADVTYAVPPGGKSKDGEPAFGAVLELPSGVAAGLYQVSLSAKGWIDVAQGGAPLKAVAHSGKSDCEAMRKSVRFDVKDGPLTLQLSGISAREIKVTIRKAD